MELGKKKYLREEVAAIVRDVSREYEDKLSEQKARIAELVRENSDCREKISYYEDKDGQISAALKKAEAYSAELKAKAGEEYRLAVAFINNFIVKWKRYFDYLKEKYPLYPVVAEAADIQDKVGKIMISGDAESAINKADNVLKGVKTKISDGEFNPKKKIADYIAATEDGGFNMEEVLNPGALRLEDLCKELGLLTENEL